MKRSDRPRLVVVLGPPRSGVGVIAGLLAAGTGAATGVVPPTMGAITPAAVAMGHDEILASLNRDWTCPPPTVEPRTPGFDILADHAATMEARGRPWIVADSRLLFLLPVWCSLVDEMHAVGVVRSPTAAVLSTVAQTSMPEEAAGRIVHSHLVRLGALQQALRFPVINFSASPADLVAHAGAIAASLDLPWNASQASNYLSPSRIHQRARNNEPDAYYRLLAAVAGKPAESVVSDSRAIAAALTQLPSGDMPELFLNVGPAFAERHRRTWRRVDTSTVDRFVDIVPAGTPPSLVPARPGLEGDVIALAGPLSLAKELAALPAPSHVVATGLLEAAPPEGLERMLRDLSRFTQTSACLYLDGFVTPDGENPHTWDETNLTTSAVGPIYHHTRGAVESAANRTGWEVEEITSSRPRASVTLRKSLEVDLVDLPDAGRTAILSLEARIAALERAVQRLSTGARADPESGPGRTRWLTHHRSSDAELR